MSDDLTNHPLYKKGRTLATHQEVLDYLHLIDVVDPETGVCTKCDKFGGHEDHCSVPLLDWLFSEPKDMCNWPPDRSRFVAVIEETAKYIHDWAKRKGFYDEPCNNGEKIALMHSELSEALEGFRTPGLVSDKIPPFLAVEEEYADTIIRILDHAAHLKLRVAEAIVAKMAYNEGRPYRHGKEF